MTKIDKVERMTKFLEHMLGAQLVEELYKAHDYTDYLIRTYDEIDNIVTMFEEEEEDEVA